MIAVVGAATLLRAHRLGERDFWFDEGCTFYYLQFLWSWPENSSLLRESTNLPYYVLLHGWMTCFGTSEAALRSFSVVASLLTIPVLGLVAWRLGGRGAGAAAIVLAAVHPLSVYYAREARAYALWMLALSALLWLLVEAVRRGRTGWWVAYGVVLFAALPLHYFTMYWAAGSAALTWIAVDRRAAARRWAVTHAAVGILFLPYAATAVWPAARGGGSAWIAEGGVSATDFFRSLWVLLPAGDYPAHLRGLSRASADTRSPWPAWVDRAAAATPAVVLAWWWLRGPGQRKRDGDGEGDPIEREASRALAAVWVSAGISLGLALLYSALVKPTYLVGRYDVVAWPALTVGISLLLAGNASAAARARPHRTRLAVLALLAACSVVADARMLNPPREPSAAARRAARLAERTDARDVVVALSYDRWGLHYALHRAGFRGAVRSFPSWLDRQVGWVDTRSDVQALADGRVGEDAQRLAAELRSHAAAGGRVWLLGDSLDVEHRGPRAAIHAELGRALAESGFSVDVADDELLVFEARWES